MFMMWTSKLISTVLHSSFHFWLSSFLVLTAHAFEDNETYDYVIVGSGPGGGPLAANLARAGHSVLLLEAGSDQSTNVNITIPALNFLSSADPKMRWDFFVNHYNSSTNAQALKDPKMTWKTPAGEWYVGLNPPDGSEQLGIYYPRSATIGGCSTHNAMAAVLPSEGDWGFIEALTGDGSWSAENMRMYYEKVEKCNYLPPGTPGHGFNGFLQTNRANPVVLEGQNNTIAVLDAAATTLHDRDGLFDILDRDINTLDPDRNHDDAMWPITDHIDATGMRSSAQTYIDATLAAKNADGSQKYPLFVRTHSLATRVLFDDNVPQAQPKATGIEFLTGPSLYSADPRYNATQAGTPGRVFASKEIILSAGVFNTPQLLLLSGIGPPDHLHALSIPVLIDLPGVGTNLQDNYETSAVFTSPLSFAGPPTNCTLGFGPGPDPCVAEFLAGKGPYRQLPVSPAVFLKTSQANDGEVDVFLWATPAFAFLGYVPPGFATFLPQTTWGWSMVKIHPRNKKGTVRLRSSNPRGVPQIEFNFFEDGGEHDLQAMVEAVAWARRTFVDISAPLGPVVEVQPCKGVVGGEEDQCEDADMRAFIKDQAWSHHAVGTCPIGADGDEMAVLDSRFRVRGVRGLRVVDGSVFPRSPGSFPVLPTFMISEKAADVILEDAGIW